LSFIILESGILDAVDTASTGKACMKILNRTLRAHAELVNKIDQEGRLTDKDFEMLINSITAVEI
jgi:F0F1-type ATP synthase alpha subunit